MICDVIEWLMIEAGRVGSESWLPYEFFFPIFVVGGEVKADYKITGVYSSKIVSISIWN